MAKIVKPLSPSSLEDRIKAAQGKGAYVADENERHLYHVKMDKQVFNPATGEKASKAFIQKFTVQDWRDQQKHGVHLGFTMNVLWNPEAYLGETKPVQEEQEEEAEI